MKLKMGKEDVITKELLSTVRGIKPPTSLYLRLQGSKAYFNGTGSQNIWLMWLVARHLNGIEKVETDSLVLQMYDYQLNKWFGGSEFLSSIYWPWHLLSHVAMLRSKNEQIKQLALRWLVINWTLFGELTGSNGAVLCYGQRSTGHKPQPGRIDWIHAVAKNDRLLELQAEKWCKEAHLGLRQSWEWEMGQELRRELQHSYRVFEESSQMDLPSSIQLRVPSTIIQTTNGVMLVHSRTCNSNTAPILISKYEGDRLSTLPVDGGFGWRKFDDAVASVDEDNKRVLYSSAVFTNHTVSSMDFPPGDVKQIIHLGE